jgi:hypothetical protein
MPYGQIDGVGDEGAEGMDDDIAMASGAIGCWLRVVVSAEKQAKTNAGVLPLRQVRVRMTA